MPVWLGDTLRSVSRPCRAGGGGRDWDQGDLHHKKHRVLVLVAERTANHGHGMLMHHSLQTLAIHRHQLIACLKQIKFCEAIQQNKKVYMQKYFFFKLFFFFFKKNQLQETHTGIKLCTLFPAGCWRQWTNYGALRKGSSSDVIRGCQGCTCLMHSSSVKVRKHIAHRRPCWLLYLHQTSVFLFPL